MLELLVELLLGLHMRLPLVSLSGQVADEDFPDDCAQELHFAGDAPERERPKHRYRHLALVEDFEEVDGFLFDLHFANPVELRMIEQKSQ